MKKLPGSLIADVLQVGRGLLMGGADIIPGVSGGTVALILGIYERLVGAISHFDLQLLANLRHKRWAKAAEHCDLRFLAALGCGILAGIGGLGTLMHYLLEHHQVLTLSTFFGLILASSIVVAQTIERWSIPKGLIVLAGGAFAYWLVGQPFMKGSDNILYYFLCGAVAICAMILPGISGAFILLVMGKYREVTEIIRNLVHLEVTPGQILTLAVFASGCAVGLLGFSKVLRWLLARYHGQTMAVLCGFMIGSLRRIWPYKEAALPGTGRDIGENILPQALDGQFLAAIALAVGAILLVLALDWIVRHSQARSEDSSR